MNGKDAAQVQSEGFFQQLGKAYFAFCIFATDDGHHILFHALHLLGRTYVHEIRFLLVHIEKRALLVTDASLPDIFMSDLLDCYCKQR